MTVRPALATGPIDLDVLIERSTRPLLRRLPDPPPIPRAPPAARIDPPQAIVLVTTVATCQCGRIHRMPNNAVLVRYDEHGLSNSIHYKREDVERDLFMRLPREHKTHAISVPMCEGCFDVEPTPSPQRDSVPVTGGNTASNPDLADPSLSDIFNG